MKRSLLNVGAFVVIAVGGLQLQSQTISAPKVACCEAVFSFGNVCCGNSCEAGLFMCRAFY